MKSIIIATAMLVGSSQLSAQSVPMYENLKFGEKESAVYKKLDKILGTKSKNSGSSKPKNSGKHEGIFGDFGQHDFKRSTSGRAAAKYKAKTKVQGLDFILNFSWATKKNDKVLSSVRLLSSEGDTPTLTKAFNELSGVFSSLYGPSKYNNGLPAKDSVQAVNAYTNGATWFFDKNSVALALGKTTKGYILVVDFMDHQPVINYTEEPQ